MTGFVEGDEPGAHGHVSAQSPSTNGSSGKKVAERYLAPLGIDATDAAFTDVCPIYFVKYGTPAKREQGDAIAAEYDAIAADLGFEPASLPKRQSAASLVKRASTEFADRTIADLEQADADLVVTLGNEALQALANIENLSPEAPAQNLQTLRDDSRYGARGKLRVNGRDVDWLPLAHPGLLRGGSDWDDLHLSWEGASGG